MAEPQDHLPPADESYTWTSPDGVQITLPPMRRIKSGVIRRLRKLPDIDFMYSMLEAVMDPAELDKMDELELPQVQAMFSAWQSRGGVSVPQS